MGKNWRFKSLLVGGALAFTAASAYAGEITFFERPAFQGSYAATYSSIPDLQSTGYRDTASSVIVNDGMWEVCTGVNFGGRCAQLKPGSYSTVSRDLNGRIASVRQTAYSTAAPRIIITPDAPAVVTAPANPPVVITAPAVVGQATVVTPQSNPPVVVVAPPAGQVVVASPPPAAPMPMGRVVLYQNPNFGGPSAVVEHGRSPDLDWAHFTNPATSVRIQSGTWLACTDMGYQGQCRVLGPGDYPALAGVLDPGISSLRQIWPAA